MKPKSALPICCGILLAGAATGVAEAIDPFSDPDSNQKSHSFTPAEAILRAKLEKLGPRLKGLAVEPDADGTCSVSVAPEGKPDLSALTGLPVRKIEIFGSMDQLASGEIMDLAPLAGLPLESLWIWKVPLKELSPLKFTRLKKLLIMRAGVTDVSPLKDLPLTDLDLWSTDVSDISPLKGMRLKHLNIDTSESAKVTDLSPLEGMELESLQFHANGVIKGIEVVRRMKSLKEINRKTPDEFWKEYEADGPAREMVAKVGLNFTKLYAGGDGKLGLWFRGDDLVDLAPLKGLPVDSLGFRESRVSDLRPLAGLPLRNLCIKSPVLTDLSPLRGNTITELYLACEHLIDLSPLGETKLQTLFLSCPKVTDLTAIRGLPLKILSIRRSGVVDLSNLQGMTVEYLYFDPEKISKGLEVLRGMKDLKQINGCDVEYFWKENDSKNPSGEDSPFRDPFEK